MCKSYILQRVRFPYLAKASNLSNLYNNPPTPAGCWGSAPEKNAPETEADRQAARPADRQTEERQRDSTLFGAGFGRGELHFS